jgi:hypothetical protein
MKAQRSVSKAASLPAPVGGWNARDALGDMDPSDAVSMVNWFPQTSDVQLRKGYSQFATGISGQVETIFSYAGASSNKMFAFAGTSAYETTAGGAVGAAVLTGLTNARWQYINVSTSGGNFLLSVNGADKLRGYDGTNWYTDGDGSHDITGVNTANCININLFKNRVWFIEKNTLKAWYLPTSSIAGAATQFNFQGVARKGGYLVAMGTWTIDAGYGVDDIAVFITSQGEVITYGGTDPSSSTTWSLVGVFEIGAPLGTRCYLKFAGDILLATQDGVVPLSGELQSSRVNPRVALTDKIQFAMSNAATTYGSNFGWQMIYYAKANMLMLNVPVSTGSQEQYAMNTITKNWGQFQNVSANCWEIFNDEPYFGGNGYVGKFWNSFSDNSTNINGTCKQAFNYFGMRGALKRWTLMRPTLLTNGSPQILSSIDIDFGDTASSSALSFTPTSYAVWDTAIWDTSVWGGDLGLQSNWQGVNGIGYCCAPRIQVASNGIEVHWVATDLVMERGAIL